jgi:hypothetical protein
MRAIAYRITRRKDASIMIEAFYRIVLWDMKARALPQGMVLRWARASVTEGRSPNASR